VKTGERTREGLGKNEAGEGAIRGGGYGIVATCLMLLMMRRVATMKRVVMDRKDVELGYSGRITRSFGPSLEPSDVNAPPLSWRFVPTLCVSEVEEKSNWPTPERQQDGKEQQA
jgi:hypothetical protein